MLTHLRTSNPIESIFAGIRLRTDDAAKRVRVRENALYLVFKPGDPVEPELAYHQRP